MKREKQAGISSDGEDTSRRRNRRQALALGGAAAAAAAATALGASGKKVDAATGGNMVIGHLNEADAGDTTSLSGNVPGNDAAALIENLSTDKGIGLQVTARGGFVSPQSPWGAGPSVAVYGIAQNADGTGAGAGHGVMGWTGSGRGVHGVATEETAVAGVAGSAPGDAPGVSAFSGTIPPSPDGGLALDVIGKARVTVDSDEPALGAENPSGIGVKGLSTDGSGIHGESEGGGFGVEGFSADGSGILGVTNAAPGGPEPSAAGVTGASLVPPGKGLGDQIGVSGISGGGPGVKGEGKHGVIGKNNAAHGAGVRGVGNGASGSMGVHAKNSASKRALRTQGRVQMDCARTRSLANKSNLVALPSGVNAGSKVTVLATMQGSPGNDALIQRAFRVDSKHIRIVFNKKPARRTKVGYWVVHTG